MFFGIRKILPFLFLVSLAGFTYNGIPLKAGGEVPWPLSNQEVISVDRSKGLWKLSNQEDEKIFNVEMVADPRSGFDWVRVSELDPKSWEVVSWGEGFFSQNPNTLNGQSSYFDVTLNAPINDKLGRYLTMFPNGDLNQDSYLLRLVEVKTSVGNVLGLSVISYSTMDSEHFLGTRMLKAPLACNEDPKAGQSLVCHID